MKKLVGIFKIKSSFYRSVFVKWKVKLLLPTLTEICPGLSCYGFLNLIKENSAIFNHIFCPSGLFTWTCEVFMKVAKPKFSENGSNKFSVEQFVYKNFLDMAEAIFMDDKYFHQILFFSFNIQCKGCYSSCCFSVTT